MPAGAAANRGSNRWWPPGSRPRNTRSSPPARLRSLCTSSPTDAKPPSTFRMRRGSWTQARCCARSPGPHAGHTDFPAPHAVGGSDSIVPHRPRPHLAGALIDASAFLRSEDAALPDIELARALRPALLTLSGPLLVVSSPHRKVGLLYNAHRRYFGNDAETRGLYIQASSRDLNPPLDEAAIAAAQSEYLGVFRADLQAFSMTRQSTAPSCRAAASCRGSPAIAMRH